MPSVSVVITTHNRVQLLQRAIESARQAGSNFELQAGANFERQAGSNLERHAGSDLAGSDLSSSDLSGSNLAGAELEIIVVDDCSTDGTPEFCSKLPDIRYVRLSSNRGLAYARNVGIAESSAEFIAFLDDDDLRLPGSLAKQLRVLQAADRTTADPQADDRGTIDPATDHRTAFCYGQALIGDARRQLPTGEIYPTTLPQGDIFWNLLEHNFIPMPSVLARKSCLLEAGCFNTDLNLIEDWDMWLRLSEHFLVAAVEEPVAIHRKASAESNQMCSNPAELCKQALRVQQMALNRPRAQAAPAAKRRYVRRKFRNRAYEILMTEATNSIHVGDSKSARANLLDAFRFRPLRTLASGRLPWLLAPLR